MHEILDGLWLDALETRIDAKVTDYLRKHHQDYQEADERQDKLLEQYPIIRKFLDGDDVITLDAKEHHAIKEYILNREDMEHLEREYHYYYGQSQVFSYGNMLKSIQREISLDGDVSRKKKLLDMLIEARTGDAELEYLKTDEKYQKRRNVSLQQEEILKAMNLPKEIMDQVDKVISSNSDHWSRYSDLIYQYAVQDILALLLER